MNRTEIYALRGIRRLAIFLFAAMLLIGGCAKKSPYIRFGNAHKKTASGGEVPIQHYVGVFDPASGKPIGGLGNDNFSVSVKGKTIQPNVQPSSNMIRDQLGIALVIDQGGGKSNWEELKEVANELLLQIEQAKSKAALMGANGSASKYVFEEPAAVRSKIRSLAATGNGFGLTYPAIGEIKNSGRQGLSDKTRLAIVAIICGKPSGAKPEMPEGVPLVLIDMAATNDPDLIALAESSKGLYVPYAPNQVGAVATKALSHIKRELADLYVVNFKVSQGDLPLRYSLTYKNGPVTTTGDFVDDEWTQRYALIAGLAAAIVAIVAVVFISKRRKSAATASASGWSAGDYTIAGGSGSPDDDATRAGMDTSSGYGSPAQSYAPPQSSYQSMGGGSTSADFSMGGGSGGGIGPSPGDVTAGAMDVIHPTTGGYGGGGTDATVGEMAAVSSSPGSGYGSMTSPITIRIESGGAVGRDVRLTSATKIGRGDYFASSFGAIALPGDPKVSREHSELVPETRAGATVWTIVNRSSTNKTYVNDSPIDSPRVLYAGDRIRVGETILRVADVAANDGDSTMR